MPRPDEGSSSRESGPAPAGITESGPADRGGGRSPITRRSRERPGEGTAARSGVAALGRESVTAVRTTLGVEEPVTSAFPSLPVSATPAIPTARLGSLLDEIGYDESAIDPFLTERTLERNASMSPPRREPPAASRTHPEKSPASQGTAARSALGAPASRSTVSGATFSRSTVRSALEPDHPGPERSPDFSALWEEGDTDQDEVEVFQTVQSPPPKEWLGAETHQDEAAVPSHQVPSNGAYSLRGDSWEVLTIPKAPRVPVVEEVVDEYELEPSPDEAPPGPPQAGAAAAGRSASAPRLPFDTRISESTPPPSASRLARKLPSTVPPPSRRPSRAPTGVTTSSVMPEARRRGPSLSHPPQILIPAPLKGSAKSWLLTGSLQLPDTVSARHARALQRALLLSLLLDYGFSELPEGLKRRAAWLFRDGWADGSAELDASDLCFVLGLPPDEFSRATLRGAVSGLIPSDALPPPSSPRLRSSSRPPHSRR